MTTRFFTALRSVQDDSSATMRPLTLTRALTAILAAAVLLFGGVGCPASKPAPSEPTGGGGEGVLLQYKFPEGRVLQYRTTSKTRMRFTIPFISDIQQVRGESVVDILEKVLQAPIGGYASIEQRVAGMLFRLYKGDHLIFDSTRPDDFPTQQRLMQLSDISGAAVRYEINASGDIRRAEGLENMANIVGSGAMSRIFQGAQPAFPTNPVSPGESWQSSRKTPLAPGGGYQGVLEITDKSKLIEIKEENSVKLAVIELKRELTIRINALSSNKHAKNAVKGAAHTRATITFDIERGIIVNNKGRMSISTSAAVSDQPLVNDMTIEIEGLYETRLLESH